MDAFDSVRLPSDSSSTQRSHDSPTQPGHDTFSQSQGHDETHETHESGEERRKHPDIWRPAFHLTAPRGWLNDPCAPGYDAAHDVYHVGFQWNPKSTEWGNISWGSAHSRDLVSWAASDTPSLAPMAKQDPCGVFTGCMSPTTLEPDTLTAFYTSISHLPLHHSIPYKYGSEALHMATSIDSGRTWRRFAGNPVLPGPPAHLDVTGWRDPYVAPWPSLSAELGQPTDTLYGILSGGIRGCGPTAFLYQLDRDRIGVWNFLSILVSLPVHLTLDFGKNWECANFVSLPVPDTLDMHDFLVFGAEGRLPNALSRDQTEFRVDHAQMWMCGKLRRGDGQAVTMDYQYGGRLDYGAYYAGNSFWDPKVKRQVILGWIVEEDLPLDLTRRQGWAGMLSLPRVLSVQSLRSVVGTVSGRSLDSIASVGLKRENDDSATVVASGETIAAYTVTTLCATPDERLASLRSGPRALSLADFERGSELSLPHGPTAWEMDMAFDVGASVGRVGLIIEHNPPGTFLPTASYSKPVNFIALTIIFHRHKHRQTITNNHLLRPTGRGAHHRPPREHICGGREHLRRGGAAPAVRFSRRGWRRRRGAAPTGAPVGADIL